MTQLHKVIIIAFSYATLMLAGVFVAAFVHRDAFDVREGARVVEVNITEGPQMETVWIQADDAHQQRMLEELREIVEWAGQNDLFISEMGVPSNVDTLQYRSLLAKFFEAANIAEMDVTSWAVGESWGDYPIAPHVATTLDDNALSDIFTKNLTTSEYFRGVNLAGAEFGLNPDARGDIGEIGGNHTYHQESLLWQKIADKGYTHVRYPFRLERLFNPDTGEVEFADSTVFLQALEKARAAGLKVILDPHNYGALQVDGRTHILGRGAFQLEKYEKMMTNIATLIVGYEDVVSMIGLMNEPKNVRPQTWETYAQAGLDALRSAGWKGQIEVPTGKWQGAKDVAKIHPKPWIIDPQDNFTYGVHQYYDSLEEGSYKETYENDEKEIRRKYEPSSVGFEREVR